MADSVDLERVQGWVAWEIQSMKGDIIMNERLRPCLYKGERGVFHGWFERRWLANISTPSDVPFSECCCSMPVGIVENHLGQVIEARPVEIRFLDDLAFKISKGSEVKNLEGLHKETEEV